MAFKYIRNDQTRERIAKPEKILFCVALIFPFEDGNKHIFGEF